MVCGLLSGGEVCVCGQPCCYVIFLFFVTLVLCSVTDNIDGEPGDRWHCHEHEQQPENEEEEDTLQGKTTKLFFLFFYFF